MREAKRRRRAGGEQRRGVRSENNRNGASQPNKAWHQVSYQGKRAPGLRKARAVSYIIEARKRQARHIEPAIIPRDRVA